MLLLLIGSDQQLPACGNSDLVRVQPIAEAIRESPLLAVNARGTTYLRVLVRGRTIESQVPIFQPVEGLIDPGNSRKQLNVQETKFPLRRDEL